MHILPPLLVSSLLALTGASCIAQSVALSGVAGSKALVVIDAAAPRFLSPGQSHQGVKLLGTQGDTATLEVNGERRTLRVGDAPVSVGKSGNPESNADQRIVLTADSRGHFMPAGQINGREVQFLVDTGASSVAMSESDARRINLKFENGQKVRLSTANGASTGYLVRLDSVRVGSAVVYNVEAVVSPQTMPFVLLGNSFLNRFQMQKNNDQLTLEKRR